MMSILDLFSLDGKVAVVTGGSRGLGQAMAIGLAEAGADIVVINYSADCSETKAQIEALGRRFLNLTYDLIETPVARFPEIMEEIREKMGRLDILVNNAGIIRRARALEFAEQDWDHVIAINQKAVFFLSQAAARLMNEQGGGKIIIIASMLSFQGGILVPSYTASKSAVAGLTHALANEWAALNINVNAIAPGYMETDNTAALRADEQRNTAILSRIPAGRWGSPDDLKGIAVFLASEASSYMHGTIVPVDGAWLSR
jgi:2-deoxy-D-gluconate 3-dehydrogenase